MVNGIQPPSQLRNTSASPSREIPQGETLASLGPREADPGDPVEARPVQVLETFICEVCGKEINVDNGCADDQFDACDDCWKEIL